MKKLLLLLMIIPMIGFGQSSKPAYIVDSVNVRYIFLSNDNFSVDSAFTKLNFIRNAILLGEDFGELAKNHSEDKSSAKNGGSLGWFDNGVMIIEFEEACFNSEIGDLKIIYTRLGTMLFQIIDNRGFVVPKLNFNKKY